ncbi:hypothetical protein L7F22_001330 [Adiantum nelumboides]|nr:hypothetical protein [Adiantum nelumboides]
MAIEHYATQAEQRRQKFNEGLKDKELKRGMLVLRYDNRFDTRKDRKFMTRWEGPYVIRKKYINGSYRLQDISGNLSLVANLIGSRLKHGSKEVHSQAKRPAIDTEVGIPSATTITTLEEETVIHHHNEEPPQSDEQSQQHDEQSLQHDEQTPTVRSRLLGKQIELDLLQDALEKFLVRRNSSRPLVPLCRLIPNEAIRTVSSHINIFQDTFDKSPYATIGAPFIVSLLRPGKNEYLEVNDVDLHEWGPTWTQVNDEFKRELTDSEWMDLKGRKFLCWDGNHRLKAWLPHICKAWSHIPSRHFGVQCQFIEVEKRREGELLLALQSQNELARTHMVPTLSHEVFMFQTFGQADKTLVREQLGADIRRWVDLEYGLERLSGTPCIDTFLEKISQNTSRMGEPCKTVAHMVWAHFPSGLAVSQVGNLECPPWNVFDGDVLHAVTQFAANYVDKGWTITLRVDSGYTYEYGEEVWTLALGIFYQRNCQLPLMDGKVGEDIAKPLFDAKCNFITESSSVFPFERTIVGNQYICGDAEKSPLFFRWLLKTFTSEGNVVLDAFAGCGGLVYECEELH